MQELFGNCSPDGKIVVASRTSLRVVAFHWLPDRILILFFQGGLQSPEDSVYSYLSLTGKQLHLWVLIGALGDLFIEFSRDIFAL